MTIEITKENETMTGLLNGRLDTAAIAEFSQRIATLKENADKRIILDFAGLQFISLPGIKLLQSLQSMVKNCGGSLSIRNAAMTIMQLFTATGFASMFNFE